MPWLSVCECLPVPLCRQYDYMRRIGGGWHFCTAIAVPNGNTLVVSIERRHTQGAFLREQAAHRDLYRPHLARAALLAARYSRSRYEAAVDDLEALGLAAAAVSRRGSLIACNGGFRALMQALAQDGLNGLVVTHQSAQAQVQAHLARTRSLPDTALTASIPIPAEPGRGPAIVDLVPVSGAARDIFPRTACLVVITMADTERLPKIAFARSGGAAATLLGIASPETELAPTILAAAAPHGSVSGRRL